MPHLQQDARSLHPLYDQAKAHGLTPEVYERMLQIAVHFKKNNDKMGGLIGDVIHMAKYTSEGVAFMMLYAMLSYLFQTIVLPPHLKELGIYHNLPDELKYQPNAQGQYPTLYRYKKVGQNMVLTDEVIPQGQETELDILMNGFMPEPTEDMGYRNRFEDFLDEMQGPGNVTGHDRKLILDKIREIDGKMNRNANASHDSIMDYNLVNMPF